MIRLRSRDQRGAAMVEFALIVPIFLMLLFGIISYGYMLSYRQAVSQAASEGARAMAVAPSSMGMAERQERAIDAINDSLSSYGIRCDGTALTRNGESVGSCPLPEIAACDSGLCAHVSVEHDYRDHPLIPSFPGFGVTLPETLSYTAVVEVS